MASVNKVFLIGNLTRDVEVRNLAGGAAVADLGLACNHRYKTRDGELKEETTFVDVAVWNRDAENCARFLRKGSPVHVEGHLKMDSWDDKQTGQRRSKLKVEAERVQFLGGRDDGGRRDAAPAQPAPPPPAHDDQDIPF